MLRNALRIAFAIGSFATGAAAGAADAYFAPEPAMNSGAPYSAVITTQSTTVFSDGNRIVRSNTVHLYRDGQGRTRIERVAQISDGDDAQEGLVTINDPVSGQRYVLDTKFKRALIMPLRAPATRAKTSDQGFDAPFALLGFGMGIGATAVTESSSSETSLGQKLIQGLNATGTRMIRTIPSGVLGNEKPIISTSERWFSPDLGVPIKITQKSSLGGEVSLTLEQVIRAEPDPALFTTPADYKRQDLMVPTAALQ
jgi:hypothetical protein